MRSKRRHATYVWAGASWFDAQSVTHLGPVSDLGKLTVENVQVAMTTVWKRSGIATQAEALVPCVKGTTVVGALVGGP